MPSGIAKRGVPAFAEMASLDAAHMSLPQSSRFTGASKFRLVIAAEEGA